MSARTKNAAELGKVGIRSDHVVELQAISRSLHRLDEYACNGDTTPWQDRRSAGTLPVSAVMEQVGTLGVHRATA